MSIFGEYKKQHFWEMPVRMTCAEHFTPSSIVPGLPDTIHQNGKNIPKTQNIPNGHKIYEVAVN
jgi:hypothetical protein